MSYLKYILLLVSLPASSAPFLYSEPTSQPVTYCGLVITNNTINTTRKTYTLVQYVPLGKRCKFDIGILPPGNYTFSATFYGFLGGKYQESIQSNKINFNNQP